MRVNTATMQMTQSVNLIRLFVQIFKQLIWCRHPNMSRAFTINDEPYRLCLKCGVRLDKGNRTNLQINYF